MRNSARKAHHRRHWGGLLVLGVVFLLAGCASWTHPTKPSAAFADDAAACKAAARQAAVTSGQADFDQDNAYTRCLREKGWTLRERR